MCPKCHPSAFSEKRLGPNHISPRFGNCRRWEVYVDGEEISNGFEYFAGEQGWIWFYNEGKPCPCGSGYPIFEFLGAKVELTHKAHPVLVEFDNGTSTLVTCPEMHLGPYDKWKEPSVVEAKRQEARDQVEELLRNLGNWKTMLQELEDQSGHDNECNHASSSGEPTEPSLP